MNSSTGTTTAPTITAKIPVSWTLATDGTVTANNTAAGRIIESLPGRLYYASPAIGGDWDASFGAADKAAAALAVLTVLRSR